MVRHRGIPTGDGCSIQAGRLPWCTNGVQHHVDVLLVKGAVKKAK